MNHSRAEGQQRADALRLEIGASTDDFSTTIGCIIAKSVIDLAILKEHTYDD